VDFKNHFKHSLALAGKIKKAVKPYVGKYRDIAYPLGETGDTTYEVDVPAEEAVEEFFIERGIDAAVMTEDRGIRYFGENPDAIYLIDPLDGSRNARRNLPFYCTSIAVYPLGAKYVSDCASALVSRIDAKKQYSAFLDEPSRCNGKKIRPSGKKQFQNAVIALGSHFSSSYPIHAKIMEEISGKSLGTNDAMIKCLGASALELCLVASGELDAFIDLRSIHGVVPCMKTYDVASAAKILQNSNSKYSIGSSKLPEKVILNPKEGVSAVSAGSPDLFKALLNMIGY
jgi:fructose-1,6-bisphosphatase/inositol monophosphatase family enzyme